MRIRAELPVTKGHLYFNTGWSGPMSERVVMEQTRVLERLSREGVSHHNYGRFMKDIGMLRSRLARLFGAEKKEIALTRSTTEAINIVLNGIDWERGRKIVTTNVEHGAGLIPVYALRERYGVDIGIVDLSDGRDVMRKFSRAIDERTRLVVVSHVSFNTGLRLPLKKLSEMVTERGSELLADGAQSAGVFRIDFHDIGCAYYSFPGHKWMLGPDTTGALYVRKDRLPRLKLSFAGNESAKTFDGMGNVRFERDARKFQFCDFNPALISGWLKALELMEEVGMEAIESAIRSNVRLLKRLLRRIAAVRIVTPTQWEQSAGLVSIEISEKESKDVFSYLLERGIVTRYTPPPSYLRISVNYFNTREEIDELAGVIKRFCR